MDIPTVKVVLELVATWGVLDEHSDIPNAYVKAGKEAYLDICLSVPRGMDVSGDTLRDLGAANSGDVILELHKSLYGLK